MGHFELNTFEGLLHNGDAPDAPDDIDEERPPNWLNVDSGRRHYCSQLNARCELERKGAVLYGGADVLYEVVNGARSASLMLELSALNNETPTP